MSKYKCGLNNLLLARIADVLTMWVWGHTEDAKTGVNRPPSFVEALMEQPDSNDEKVMSFETGEDFDEYYESLARRVRGDE